MDRAPHRGRFYSIEDVIEKKKIHVMKKRNFTPDRESRLQNFDIESECQSLDSSFAEFGNKIKNDKKKDNEDRILRDSIRKLKSNGINPIIHKPTSDPYNNSIIFQNDYSFISTYLKFKQNRVFQEKLKFDFQVTISNYIINESDLNLFNHVKYTLEGYFDGKELLVERRYKEFLAFRKLLSQNWPGLFIPPIPPKKDLGNLEETFINLRKKFLQQFFNRIQTAPHLCSSLETKIFLESRNKNYMDMPFEIYFKTPQCIYSYYKQYFEFLIERDLTKVHKSSINEFYLKLSQTKKKLEDILFITTESINLKLENDKLCSDFYEYFYDFGNSYVYDMLKVDKETRSKYNNDLIECGLCENLYRRNYENSFQTFYDWANSQLIDVGAMIECISSVYKYQELFENKFYMLNSQNEELNKISNPNFLNSFLFAQDLKSLEGKTLKVENLKDEVLLLKKLVDMLYKIIYYVEIPTFKRDRIEFYKKFICKLVQNENNDLNKNLEIFKFLVDHSKNIMHLYSDISR